MATRRFCSGKRLKKRPWRDGAMGNWQLAKSTQSDSKGRYWASVLELFLCFLWCFTWDFVALPLGVGDAIAPVAGVVAGVGFCAWAATPNANTAASMRIALFISIIVLSNSSGFRFDPVHSDPQRSTLELKPHSPQPAEWTEVSKLRKFFSEGLITQGSLSTIPPAPVRAGTRLRNEPESGR